MSRSTRNLSIRFPVGGLDKRYGFQNQPPYTTAYCLNVWPTERTTGRERGGVRPGVSTLASRASAPYHWCQAVYVDSGVQTGIAAVFADGTYTTLDGVTWTERIATDPGTNFATCAVYNGALYQAAGGGKCLEKTLPGGATQNLQPDTGGGTDAPENCGIVWVHQDRLALAGDTVNPNRVYFSAVNDSGDWDSSTPAVGSSVVIGGPEGGYVGSSVTAAIAHDGNTSLVGSATSIYAIIGQPSLTSGRIARVSDTVGPLMQNAWCKGIDNQGNNNTYMFTMDGLYVIPAGSLTPQRLSREKLPNDLVGVDPGAGDRVCIGYDQRWPGIWISVDYNSGTDVDYFYDLQSGGWWPMDFENITPHVYASFPALMSSTESSILPISSGGNVVQFNSASEEDFNSYVAFGPIMLGEGATEGKLVGITAALGKDSDAVNCKGYIGETVEQAYQKLIADSSDFTLAQWTYSSTQYLNYWQHVSRAGYAMFLKVYDVANEEWLLEEILLELQTNRARRRL